MLSEQPSLAPIDWKQATPEDLLARIADVKIVGMGGAGFPTAEKIAVARQHLPCVVIANGMETDPGVCSDKVLLKTHLPEVLEGMRIIVKILEADQCHIAVSNEQIAISTQAHLNDTETVRLLKPTYQNGAERELITILTGHVVKHNRLPVHEGYIVLNVHTLFAVAQAISGTPLTKRLVSIQGETRWIDIGTPIDTIMERNQPIRVGCYATGYRPKQNEKLSATTNAISIDRSVHALPCIHCGWCDEACPRNLPIEALYLAAERQQPNTTVRDTLDRCNDCGACVVACPSNIHLLDYVRLLRQSNREEQNRKLRAIQARVRVEARERRLRSQKTEVDQRRSDRMLQTHKWQ